MIARKMLRRCVLAAMCLMTCSVFSQSIQSTGKLNTGRSHHQSQLLPDGKVLVFGGWDNIYLSNATYASAEVYDPATQTWTMTAPMSQARVFFASVVLPDGNIMALGGEDGKEQIALASCEIYDIQTKTWSPAASMNKARKHFRAIRLRNGNILVAGGTSADDGDNTCELYNPTTNTWTYTGSMNVPRGSEGSLSLVMLANGNIFASGGATPSASLAAEIYNPQTGLWISKGNIAYPRMDHNAVLLPNGKVMLVGSAFPASDGAKYSEIYDANVGEMVSGARHSASIPLNNPIVLLDNGSVFAHTTGEYSASNTQAYQIYNPSTNRWIFMTATSFFGNHAYTVHKLNDGSIIIIGGVFSIDFGATKDCFLVREPGVTVCSTDVGLELSDNTFCYGTDGKTVVSASEAGSTYQAFIGDVAVSTAVNGGGDITLNVPASYITPAINRVRVKVTKSGCVSKYLSDVAVLHAYQENIDKPVITNAKPLTFCPGDNTVLQAPAGSPKYLWSNGETTADITVTTQSGAYSVKVFNSLGCASPSSNPLNVTVYPSTVSAGSDEIICISQPAFVLSGMSSTGGTWSGKGVSADGTFNPAVAGAGIHELTYTLCSRADKKIVTVLNPVLLDFTLRLPQSRICQRRGFDLFVDNPQYNVSYQLRVGTQNLGKAVSSSDGKPVRLPSNSLLFDTTTTFNVLATLTPLCGPPLTLEKSVTVTVVPVPKPFVSELVRDSICSGESAVIRIEKSQPGVKYSFAGSSTPFLMGNGEDLFLSTGPIYYDPVFDRRRFEFSVGARDELGCDGTGLQWHHVTLKPLTVDFAPGLPGDIVGDTVRFINKSDGQSYQWKFKTPASVATATGKDPGFITYSSPGEKEIQLIGVSSIGCVDSVTKVMEIAENYINVGHYSACFNEQAHLGDGIVVLDYHTDRSGNSYITGHNKRIMFCAKIDSTGKKVWSRDMPWSDTSFGTGITSDTEGNAYIVGHATGTTFEFGTFYYWIGHRIHEYSPYMFIIKLNKAGEEQWMITGTADADFYDSNYDNWVVASDIASDKDDRIYVTGHRFFKPVNIRFPDGTTKRMYSGDENRDAKECFILEIDKAGSMQDYVEFGGGSGRTFGTSGVLWGATINGWLETSLSSIGLNTMVAVNPKIKIDSDGDLLVGGVFVAPYKTNPFHFGHLSLYTVQDEDYDPVPELSPTDKGSTFIAEYNKAQGWKSAVRGVTIGVDYLQEFTKDRDGNIYTIGSLRKKTFIQGDSIFLPGDYRYDYYRPRYSYLAKNNPSGTIEWYSIQESVYLHDVDVTDHNTVFVTGQFDRFGILYDAKGKSFGITSHGKKDGFLSEFTADGSALWATPLGASNVDHPYYVETDACNNMYLCSAADLTSSAWPALNGDGSVAISKLSLFGNCAPTECATRKLTLVSFDPGAGMDDDEVNITGTNFAYVTAVTFNGVDAAFTIISDNHIVATVPADATTGKIGLKTYNESVASSDDFVIEKLRFIDFTPKTGTAGIVVTIYAKHLANVQTVRFHDVAATAFIFVNDSTIRTAVPQGATTGAISLSTSDETVVSTDVFTVEEVVTGTENEFSKRCILYPNPTAGEITLECLTMNTSYEVEIFNLLGVRVAQQRLDGSSRQNIISVAHLPAGVYQVMLSNEKQRAAYRVVKE